MVTKKKAKQKRLFKDIAERVLTTFVQGFIVVWAVAEDMSFDEMFSMNNLKGGIVGGVLALIKGFAASRIGAEDSASLAE